MRKLYLAIHIGYPEIGYFIRRTNRLSGNLVTLSVNSKRLPGNTATLPVNSRRLPGNPATLPVSSDRLPGNLATLPVSSDQLPGNRHIRTSIITATQGQAPLNY